MTVELLDRLRTYLNSTEHGMGKMQACEQACRVKRGSGALRKLVAGNPEFIITKSRGINFVKFASKQKDAEQRKSNWAYGQASHVHYVKPVA